MMDLMFGRPGIMVRFGGGIEGRDDEEEEEEPPETTSSLKSPSRSCNSIPSSRAPGGGFVRSLLLLEIYNSIPSVPLWPRYGKAHAASSKVFTAHTNLILPLFLLMPRSIRSRYMGIVNVAPTPPATRRMRSYVERSGKLAAEP